MGASTSKMILQLMFGTSSKAIPRIASILAFASLSISSLGLLVCLLLPNNASAQQGAKVDEDLHNYAYLEDFETKDPFLPWVSDGSYVVHYKGLNDERSTSGHRSFKLDITLQTAKYVYFRIPVDVPVASGLFFSADAYLSKDERVGVAVGPQILFRPSPFEGYLNDRYIQQTGRWVHISYNLAAQADRIGDSLLRRQAGSASMRDVIPWVSQIGVYLFSETGGRVTLYLDNIQITGRLPTRESQIVLASTRWNGYLERIRKEVPAIMAQMKSDSTALNVEQNKKYGQEALRNAHNVIQAIARNGFPDGIAYTKLTEDVKELKVLRLHESKGLACASLLSLHPRKAISNSWPGPTDYPLSDPPGEQLAVSVTPGDSASTAFTLHAFNKLSDVEIGLGAVASRDSVVSPDAFDVRLVKYWYQAGKGTISRQWKFRYLSQSFLVPELLVHDDGLVKVDTDLGINYLKVEELGRSAYLDISSTPSALPRGVRISDAATLQPFTVKKGENKQVWITAHVPKEQKPGIYTGALNVYVNGQSCGGLNLRLEVLPFRLVESPIEYGIYYRGKISGKAPPIGSEEKTRLQYKKELEDIKSHGIQAVTVYDEKTPMVMEALNLRKELGFRTDKAFLLSNGTGTPKNNEELKALTARVIRQVTEVSKAGYGSTYLYAKEESHGADVLQIRQSLKAAHRGGAKVFTAVYKDAVKYVGDLLDMAIVANALDKNLADQWHAQGKLIFSYSNPQAGIEEPDTYRKNYGLSLWCAGYDGAMIYAYQHQFGPSIWNDFDDKTYRDHVFAYPLSDGVVDTIEWEGLREGIDDVRYAATLMKVANRDEQSLEATLCKRVAASADPDSLREWIAKQIVTRSQ